MAIHLRNLAIGLVGAALAYAGESYLRQYHPVVSPHSSLEAAITLLFLLFVLAAFLMLPFVVGSLSVAVQFPLALRCLAWLCFGVGVVVLFNFDLPSLISYVLIATCCVLFATDAACSLRSESWPLATLALLGWLPSGVVFFLYSGAILYFE